MTDATTPSELDALRAQVENRALDLVGNHLADIYNAPEGTAEATVRLLAARGLLTTPELRRAEADQTISLNRVLNHVPVDKHKAEVRRYTGIWKPWSARLTSCPANSTPCVAWPL